MRRLVVCVGLCSLSAFGQVSYFNSGLLRQPSAAADRAYLGVNSTNDISSLGLAMTNYANVVSNSSWHIDGNRGLGAGGGILGTLDASPVNFQVNGLAMGKLGTDRSVVLGTGTASAASAIAIGNAAAASGLAACAVGFAANAEQSSSFAFGYLADSKNSGSFVYHDSTLGAYTDTGANQFVVYATGGIDLHTGGGNVATDGTVTTAGGYWILMNSKPAAAVANGAAFLWNSNGVVYLLTSDSGSTVWSGTTKLGP